MSQSLTFCHHLQPAGQPGTNGQKFLVDGGLAPASNQKPSVVSKAWAEAMASRPLGGCPGEKRQGMGEGGPCSGSKRHLLYLLVHRLVINRVALLLGHSVICMGSCGSPFSL